ncbi:MAG: zinc ribbon domain-containing protein [Kiritimatiellae bacterium]|nr:zinc ribbon domain-containing protein [Kiritimatiellia bacterium]
MFCAKCGTKVADGQKFCPSCGMSVSGEPASDTVQAGASAGTPVVVVKEKSGCFKGCAIVVGAMVVIGFAIAMFIGHSLSEAEKAEQMAAAESSAVPIAEAAKNGEALIAWVKNKNKNGQTDLARDEAFAKLKGKTVILLGKVREIDKTAFSEEVYVSLKVGRIDLLENLNIKFYIRKSQTEKVKAWSKGEVHALRGRIKDQGGISDDAGCDLAEIVEGGALDQLKSLQTKTEQMAAAKSSAVPIEEAVKNGNALIAWVKDKGGRTDLARDEAFAKLKGKTAILRGRVREIGNTALSGELFVSLTVGRISSLENLNIQFNVRESQAEKVKMWNKGEVRTMRGRIMGQGDLSDDAVCDLGEIVEGVPMESLESPQAASHPHTTDSGVSGQINIETIKASIRKWQKTRWKSDVIESARKEHGKVTISDLTEKCQTAELQPVMDIVVADYVLLINTVDAFADANNEAEALTRFANALSLSDIAKILKDTAKILQTLGELKKGTSFRDFAKVKALAADAIAIGKVELCIGDVCGLSKQILELAQTRN